MATKVIECFEVTDHGCDGRAFPGKHIAYIVNEQEAKDLAGLYLSVTKRVLVIHDNRSDYETLKSGALKQTALAKLSPEERIALGL